MKRALNNPSLRVTLLLLAAGFIGFMFRTQSARTQGRTLTAAQMKAMIAESKIPLSGVASNDTGGRVPGNPDNGVGDLKQIHKMIQIYRSEHQGRYPPETSKLMEAVYMKPQGYGFANRDEAMLYFANPDSRYADNPTARRIPDLMCPYIISSKRPDGSLIGSSKAEGTRDVIAWSDTYAHENLRHFRGERSTSNPVGFYLVLWDDGQVEKVPYDQKLFVPIGPNSYTYGFQGQAGIPADSLTYDEFHRKAGWKNGGPRGKEGGKGESYNGLSYR